MEYALTESLANYSGGLGVLAGDHLKSASDLGLPLVAVGLLYHQGYFRQDITADGWQREEYFDLDLAAQPLNHVLGEDGTPLVVTIPFNGRQVMAWVWRLDVGKTPLFLLDTNIEVNGPADREVTARLYGGDNEMRIQQEMVLGIGGVRALQAMGYYPSVCHMNEGHSALLGMGQDPEDHGRVRGDIRGGPGAGDGGDRVHDAYGRGGGHRRVSPGPAQAVPGALLLGPRPR